VKPLREQWRDKAYGALSNVLGFEMPAHPDRYVETHAMLLVLHWLSVAQWASDRIDWRRHPELERAYEAIDRAARLCRSLSKENIREEIQAAR
jgi:hypothetical protein